MTQKTVTKSEQQSTAENVIEFPADRLAERNATPNLPMMGSVNKNELTSIKALASYVAHNKSLSEEAVKNYLLAEFKVDDVEQIRRTDYERVIRFLVDLQVDLLLN